MSRAAFYGALSSNRPWLLDGYLATIADITAAASDLAKRQFPHCEPGALYFPGHILPHGVLTSDDMDMGASHAEMVFETLVVRWLCG